MAALGDLAAANDGGLSGIKDTANDQSGPAGVSTISGDRVLPLAMDVIDEFVNFWDLRTHAVAAGFWRMLLGAPQLKPLDHLRRRRWLDRCRYL